MTSKMSTAYSGLSALIQAATSQLSDLTATSTLGENSPEGLPPFFFNPTTQALEGANLGLNEKLLTNGNESVTATVTPPISLKREKGPGSNQTKFYFPEILMLLLANPANEDIVTFLPDGKYFAIRKLKFASELLPKYFQLNGFEDFLEETRGWGFIRVNGNTNEDWPSEETNIGNSNDSSQNKGGKSNSDIYVFRHPHFSENQPVDMGKIRFRNRHTMKCKANDFFSPIDETKPRLIIEQNISSEVHSFKRQLSPSMTSNNFEDNRQRLRIESMSVNVDPLFVPGSSLERSAQQLKGRSSSELQNAVQAIIASKLHLNNSSEVKKEDYSIDNDSPMISIVDNALHPKRKLDYASPHPQGSDFNTSSLVDGGVESATQNIMTDAIEALLFDENHTRETYNRHEKELSLSSLPGVVPISKQLFAVDEKKNAASINGKSNSDETSGQKYGTNILATKVMTNEPSKSSSLSRVVYTSVGSLEDASRKNRKNHSLTSFSSLSKLRVTIPSVDGGNLSTNDSMVVSPARMEAAAALVSQSRNKNDEQYFIANY